MSDPGLGLWSANVTCKDYGTSCKKIANFQLSAVSKNETYLCSCGFSAWIMDTNPLSRKKDTFLPFGDSPLPASRHSSAMQLCKTLDGPGRNFPALIPAIFYLVSKRPEPSPMRDGSLAIHIVAGTVGLSGE